MATMGRPRKEFSKDQFEYLCALQCTELEICSFFSMTSNTLVDRIKELYEGKTFSEVRPLLAEAGKISLRRYQFNLAKKSPDMAKWMGKQMLGQREPIQKIELGGKLEQNHTHTQRNFAFKEVDPAKLIEALAAQAEDITPVVESIVHTNGNGNGANGKH